MADFDDGANSSRGGNPTGVISPPGGGAAADGRSSQKGASVSLSHRRGRKKRKRGRVSTDSLCIFTRQLATMISAGIPVAEALEILSEQVENPYFAYVLENVVDRVRAGSDLSEAFGEFPRVFNRIFMSMLRAGEASGKLDLILERLAEYMEKTAAMRRAVRAAMTYPAISMTIVTLIATLLLTVIVPKFESIFEALGGAKLPGPTRALLGVSRFLTGNLLFILGGLVGMVVLFCLIRRSESGRLVLDRIKLKLPIFGPLFRKVAVSRFSRTLATLIQSGVPILASLEIVKQTAGNSVLEKAIALSAERVREGEALAPPLAASGVFPPMVTRMISIGEKSGALDHLLDKVSEFYDQQVSSAVEGLTAMIEPILIAVMGCVVGTMVFCIFLPILEVQELVK